MAGDCSLAEASLGEQRERVATQGGDADAQVPLGEMVKSLCIHRRGELSTFHSRNRTLGWFVRETA